MLELLKTMRAEAERAKIYAEAKLEVVDRLISEVEFTAVEADETTETETPEEVESEVENSSFDI